MISKIKKLLKFDTESVNENIDEETESVLEEEFVEASEPKMFKLTRAASPEVAQESVNGVNTTAESLRESIGCDRDNAVATSLYKLYGEAVVA